jgi:hypothetical protein
MGIDLEKKTDEVEQSSYIISRIRELIKSIEERTPQWIKIGFNFLFGASPTIGIDQENYGTAEDQPRDLTPEEKAAAAAEFLEEPLYWKRYA